MGFVGIARAPRTGTSMRGVPSSAPVEVQSELSPNVSDPTSSLSIHLDDALLALASDHHLDAYGGEAGPRRTRPSRVDGSFLSFRPEPMDDEVLHSPQVTDESIEVCNNDDSLVSSLSQPWNLNGSILDITIDEDEVRSLPLEDDAGEEEDDAESGEYEEPGARGGGSDSFLQRPFEPSSMFSECPSTPSQHASTVDSSRVPIITQTPSFVGNNSRKDIACGGGSSSSLMDLTDRLVGMCFGTSGTTTPVVTPSTARSVKKSPTAAGPTQEGYPWTSSPQSQQAGRVSSLSSFPSTPSCCVVDALRLVQEDMFHVLGCSTPVPDPHSRQDDPHELSDLWPGHSLLCFRGHSLLTRLPSATTSHVNPSRHKNRRIRPSRLTLKERAERIRRFRIERTLPHQRTGLTLLATESSPLAGSLGMPVSASSLALRPLPYRKSRSLTVESRRRKLAPRLLDNFYEWGRTDADDEEMEGGYDSDPEMVPRGGASCEATANPLFPLTTLPALLLDEKDDDENHPMDLAPTDGNCFDRDDSCYRHADTDCIVHESLNLSWTLTWHAPNSGRSRATESTAEMAIWPPSPSPSSSTPLVVTISIERGTLVHGDTVMLEPSILWRQAYVPDAKDRQRSRQKPAILRANSPFVPSTHSLKLLSVTRILPGVPDRARYPLARPSCSIAVQSTSGEYFVFEAATSQERDGILKRWKVVVARFVTLAILEQFDLMAEEFFAPRTALPY